MQTKKHILLVAPYVTFRDEMGMNRFIYLAELLAKEFAVTLVTSTYCHSLKKHRKNQPHLEGVEIVMLDEPGYAKNVSFKRILSHHQFCQHFEDFLRNYDKKIDVAYSAYPLIKTNYILGKYKAEKGYKLIIDVQDVWPEAITGPIPFLSGKLGEFLMTPITWYANKTYSYADALVAVSDTYLQRADVKHLPASLKAAVYIGGDDLFYEPHKTKTTDKLVATYLGTMAGSYDLDTLVRAAPLCADNVEIQFIGTGPRQAELHALNDQLGGAVKFLGVKEYGEAMRLVANSDVALNAIKATSQNSITNKLSDYICCGLPIVSCQEQPEVKALLAQGGGVQYEAGNFVQLAECLNQLAKDPEKLTAMSEVNLKLAKERFLREHSYQQINALIKNVI